MPAKRTSTRTAGKDRKTTGKGSAAGSRPRKKVSSGEPQAKQEPVSGRTGQEPDGMKNEIILMVVLVLSVLLLLSNFNLCGAFGEVISQVMYGLFGLPAALFPFVLFFGTAFVLSNRGNRRASRKTFGAVALWISVTALIQLFSRGHDPEMSFLEYYTFSAGNKSGGGLIGGVLCGLLCPLFGTAGTFVILFALVIVCVMFLTGKALFAYISRKSEEQLAIRRQERERRLARREEEEDYEENPADAVMGARTLSKRPAKTVLIKKPAQKPADRTEDGRRESFNMKEMYPADPAAPSDLLIHDVNRIYEEELKLKFGGKGADREKENVLSGEDSGDRKQPNDVAAAAMEYDSASWEEPGEMPFDHDPERASEEFAPGHLSGPPAGTSTPADAWAGTEQEFTAEKSSVRNTLVTEKTASGPKQEIPLKSPETAEPIIDASGDGVPAREYVFPPVDLLQKPKPVPQGTMDTELKETAARLQKTLESFGVRVTITNISRGPAVTRYELSPEQGVKVSRITGLADDIKLNLAAADVRIEAPIPGKAAVGIEVPNKENTAVLLRELIDSKPFKSHPSDIAFAVGKDIGGQIVVTDIAKMPHLLIAGATGSGKSVCINTLIMSILYKSKPSEVRLIMVDPKVVELSVYNGIPHLLIPVVTDPKKASAALNWAVMEMTDRYQKFAELGVRDLKGYNEKVASVLPQTDEKYPKLPQIVIIVDELADLMMVAPGEVEDAICRLAQMARAAGLHLIIATQRPSVNVITGLIKANIPSRIAFSVSSAIDSRTIIDSAGAEKLLGRGDMLFFPSGYPKPIRVQGAFVSDQEVSAVVDFLKNENQPAPYSDEIRDKIANASSADSAAGGSDRDDYFVEAGKFIIEKDKASIGMLQRVYKIGFNRAARIMDQLAEAGVVGPEEGTKPRKVLMSLEEFEQYVDDYV